MYVVLTNANSIPTGNRRPGGVVIHSTVLPFVPAATQAPAESPYS